MKKELEEYLAQADIIDSAESAIESAGFVISFFIEKLRKDEPENSFELPSLETALEWLEIQADNIQEKGAKKTKARGAEAP